MKTKDLNKNSSSYVNNNGSFKQLSETEFFINSACVLTTNQIISIGKSFILIESFNGNDIEVSNVQLTEVLYNEELVALYVDTEMSQRMFLVDLDDDNNNCNSKWILLDIKSFFYELREMQKKRGCNAKS